MPYPLWRTVAWPSCNRISPLTSHSRPGMVTSPQFTRCTPRVWADASWDVSANPLVAVREASAATDDTMSLMFFMDCPLAVSVTAALGDPLWRWVPLLRRRRTARGKYGWVTY